MRPVTLFLTVCIANYIYAQDLEQCGLEIVERGVKKEDIKIILNKHNEFRRMVARGEVPKQPKGVNLNKLLWDDKLAEASQQKADTCKFERVGHVKDDRWSNVGLNMFLSRIWSMSNQASNGSDWASAIQTWFNEHSDYLYPHGKGCDHYTQLVWANSRYVGCGYISYKTSKHYINRIYICSYGPGGNIDRKVPYKTGTSGCEDLC